MGTSEKMISSRIDKKVDFCAAHSIIDAGECANKHGHNWEAHISIDFYGELDKSGFVVNVRDVKDAAFKYDHDDLDKYFDVASTEHVAQRIADDVATICKDAESKGEYLVYIHLIETKNNSAHAWASHNDS